MSSDLIDFIRYFSGFCVLVPLAIGFIYYKRTNNAQKALTFLMLISLATEIIALSIDKWGFGNNIAVYNLYALINFNIIWFIYQSEIPKLKNRFVWSVQVLINAFAVINAFFIQSLNIFNSNLIVVSAITYLILAFYSFRQILQDIEYTRLEKTPIFWINAGVIIYYSGTLVLFALSNQINTISESAYNLHLVVWALNCIFNIMLNTAYSLALWQRPKK